MGLESFISLIGVVKLNKYFYIGKVLYVIINESVVLIKEFVEVVNILVLFILNISLVDKIKSEDIKLVKNL